MCSLITSITAFSMSTWHTAPLRIDFHCVYVVSSEDVHVSWVGMTCTCVYLVFLLPLQPAPPAGYLFTLIPLSSWLSCPLASCSTKRMMLWFGGDPRRMVQACSTAAITCLCNLLATRLPLVCSMALCLVICTCTCSRPVLNTLRSGNFLVNEYLMAKFLNGD